MEPIEIRLNPKRVIFLMLPLVIGLAILTYYIYFSGTVGKSTTFDIMYLLMIVLMAYVCYFPIRMLVKKEPVLSLTRSDITMSQRGKSVTFLWQQITKWEFVKEEGHKVLIIRTAGTEKKINLSTLDMKPHEVGELLMKYKKM